MGDGFLCPEGTWVAEHPGDGWVRPLGQRGMVTFDGLSERYHTLPLSGGQNPPEEIHANRVPNHGDFSDFL